MTGPTEFEIWIFLNKWISYVKKEAYSVLVLTVSELIFLLLLKSKKNVVIKNSCLKNTVLHLDLNLRILLLSEPSVRFPDE